MFTPNRATALLVVVTAALYAPSLGYGFVYEDLNDFRTWSQPFALSAWLETSARSLTSLSYAAGQALSGVEAWGFHLVSILWHLVNGILLAVLSRRVVGDWPSVIVAGLFLLHPVQVESVAYISSQSELVSTLPLLLALLLVERRWWIPAWVACGLAMLGKETAVAAFLLVPLWAAWRGLPLPYVRWGAACLIPGLLVGQRFAGMVAFDPAWMSRMSTEWAGLVSLWVFPSPLSIEHDWSSPRLMVMGLALMALAWAPWRWTAVIQAALVWCAVAMLPRLFVPQLEGLHEHHLYSWSIGLSLAVGVWLVREKEAYVPSRIAPVSA